jgi:hypothetical protein
MTPKPNRQSVRRIVLPSGKCIEVVRFVAGTEPSTSPGLHLCPDCQSDLVQPVSWAEMADGRWELSLSCPNCWWEIEGVYAIEQLHDLEERLDEGLEEMLDDLQRLAHANMSDQIERFAAALSADLILPEDF